MPISVLTCEETQCSQGRSAESAALISDFYGLHKSPTQAVKGTEGRRCGGRPIGRRVCGL
eukprot:COSAG02_NODE_31839_length_526_cov_1.201405_1_plen_59_part_10